ncbi:MAG: ABC transporter permease [Chloroflexi bacterium]|nr:ABC transporter permease [Chloroflexota bacterium]
MSIAQAEASELALEQPAGLWRDAWLRLRHNPAAWAGAGLLLLFIVAALAAGLLSPYGPQERVGALASVPPGPSREFLFGLDEQGRDQLSRIIYGARLSLVVGVVSVGIGLSFGLVLGAVAGYVGGRVDGLIMRLMDIMLSIPGFLLAIGLVTLLGRGLFQIMFAIGVTTVPVFARLLRGSILAQREADYVLAARSVGTPGSRVLLRHILPNAIAPVIVQATLAMATAIIDVAGLSFVGLGPNDPSLPEWGAMLAQNAARLQNAAHLVFFPGFAIVFSVLAFNLLGDALRESIDPKMRT